MHRYPLSTICRYLDLPITQIIQTHNTHRHNNNPPSQTLTLADHPLSPNTTHTHTTATETQTHIPFLPCSSRIGKAQSQSCHPLTPTPTTPPRAKHLHMSHRPPTPLTTLISSTPPALDKHLNHVYHPYTHSPPTDPTPALPSPLPPNILAAYTHATQTTVHGSQSL